MVRQSFEQEKFAIKLNLKDFERLKKKELKTSDGELIDEVNKSSQAIYHWKKICEYHYSELARIVSSGDLNLDHFAGFKNADDAVPLRFVYEAHIVGFLQSLHALVDSFPYLLNLFVTKVENLESTSVGWKAEFINKYRLESYADELREFWGNNNFQLLKGYVNSIKHKRLISVLNKIEYLEFDSIEYSQIQLTNSAKPKYIKLMAPKTKVMDFMENCHDTLIPQLFNLCDSVLAEKRRQLAETR